MPHNLQFIGIKKHKIQSQQKKYIFFRGTQEIHIF